MELGLAVALEEDQGGEEDAAGGDDEEGDGMAIGGLGCGWGGGGIIAALGAALGVGCGGGG